jgi:hypothetical protein
MIDLRLCQHDNGYMVVMGRCHFHTIRCRCQCFFSFNFDSMSILFKIFFRFDVDVLKGLIFDSIRLIDIESNRLFR